MPIFPLIGAFVGIIAGAVTWALKFLLPNLLVSVIGLGTILLLNGAQHIDGLLDFGDGIMCHGSKAKRLDVMRDTQTGAGGFTLGWIILTATVFAIASLRQAAVFQSLTVSETAASFSMAFEAWTGRSAHKGMNSIFVDAMHSSKRKLRILIPFFILFPVAYLMLGTIAVAVMTAAIIVPSLMLLLSNRTFGGITGDIMGATNELTRLTCLTVILAGLNWV